jgi:hypothetical protein
LSSRPFSEHSTYFKDVLKQQAETVQPRSVFSIVDSQEAVQVKALKCLLRFMMRPPLDLSGLVMSKQVFTVNGVATEVLLERARWAKYLGRTKADDAIEDLKEEIERRTS